MFAIYGMQKAVRSTVLVGIAESEFISNWILLEEAKGVADTDVVVRSRKLPGLSMSEPNITKRSVLVLELCASGLTVVEGACAKPTLYTAAKASTARTVTVTPFCQSLVLGDIPRGLGTRAERSTVPARISCSESR